MRVAELMQAEPLSVEAAVADLGHGIVATLAELSSGVLLTLEVRRRWSDRRPRAQVLRQLSLLLRAVESEVSQVWVVGAVLERDGLVLAAQRSHPAALAGKWEFPGGKVERGESLATALVRECREELAVDVRVGDPLGRAELGPRAQLTLFWASLIDPADEPRRLEHAELRWCAPAELPELNWLPTNRDLAIEASRRLAREGSPTPPS